MGQREEKVEVNCGTCAFFRLEGQHHGTTIGDCMYNPPTVSASFGSERPTTRGDEWCSKWKCEE